MRAVAATSAAWQHVSSAARGPHRETALVPDSSAAAECALGVGIAGVGVAGSGSGYSTPRKHGEPRHGTAASKQSPVRSGSIEFGSDEAKGIRHLGSTECRTSMQKDDLDLGLNPRADAGLSHSLERVAGPAVLSVAQLGNAARFVACAEGSNWMGTEFGANGGKPGRQTSPSDAKQTTSASLGAPKSREMHLHPCPEPGLGNASEIMIAMAGSSTVQEAGDQAEQRILEAMKGCQA